MTIKLYRIVIVMTLACLALSVRVSAQESCSGVNEYPDWPARDWSGGDYNHANGGDRMVHQGNLYRANWYTSTVPGSDASWTLIGSCSGSSNSSSSSSSGGSYGSSCNGGSTTTVSSTIRVEDGGTFDGGCRTYNASGSLGDGQSEGQDPVFRVGPGLIRNVYMGRNGADSIHTRNGGDVENIHWSYAGEVAMTIMDPTNGATVTSSRIEGYDSADKFLQANDDGKWVVDNCRVDNAGKFLRQNGGKTFPLHVEVSNCYISNMKEGVFRSDSPNSTARITNSRLQNAGRTCIGSWRSCSSSNISN